MVILVCATKALTQQFTDLLYLCNGSKFVNSRLWITDVIYRKYYYYLKRSSEVYLVNIYISKMSEKSTSHSVLLTFQVDGSQNRCVL